MSVPSPFLINSFSSFLLITYRVFSPCIMCVQYRGGDQYRGGVQYHGGYHEYRGGYLEYRGGCSVPWGIS